MMMVLMTDIIKVIEMRIGIVMFTVIPHGRLTVGGTGTITTCTEAIFG